MNCFFCHGPAHPTTGHAYSERCLSCERCYRDFLVWYRGRLRNPIALASAGDYSSVRSKRKRG